MDNPQWRETGGAFIAQVTDFSSKVYRTADRQYVRYLVVKQQANTDELVGSGTLGGAVIGEAMNAAEKMADRLRAISKRDNLAIVPDCALGGNPHLKRC